MARRASSSTTKVSPSTLKYYFDFLSLEEYAGLLARFTIIVTRNDVTAGPLEKLRQMQWRHEIPADIDLNFTPDPRAGMMSRFLSVVFLITVEQVRQEAGYPTRARGEGGSGAAWADAVLGTSRSRSRTRVAQSIAGSGWASVTYAITPASVKATVLETSPMSLQRRSV